MTGRLREAAWGSGQRPVGRILHPRSWPGCRCAPREASREPSVQGPRGALSAHPAGLGRPQWRMLLGESLVPRSRAPGGTRGPRQTSCRGSRRAFTQPDGPSAGASVGPEPGACRVSQPVWVSLCNLSDDHVCSQGVTTHAGVSETEALVLKGAQVQAGPRAQQGRGSDASGVGGMGWGGGGRASLAGQHFTARAASCCEKREHHPSEERGRCASERGPRPLPLPLFWGGRPATAGCH